MGTLALRWFNVIGLVLDLFGVVLMMVGFIPSRKQIDEEGAPDRSGRRGQSNLVILGLVLLGLGFVFQIMGGWPR